MFRTGGSACSAWVVPRVPQGVRVECQHNFHNTGSSKQHSTTKKQTHMHWASKVITNKGCDWMFHVRTFRGSACSPFYCPRFQLQALCVQLVGIQSDNWQVYTLRLVLSRFAFMSQEIQLAPWRKYKGTASKRVQCSVISVISLFSLPVCRNSSNTKFDWCCWDALRTVMLGVEHKGRPRKLVGTSGRVNLCFFFISRSGRCKTRFELHFVIDNKHAIELMSGKRSSRDGGRLGFRRRETRRIQRLLWNGTSQRFLETNRDSSNPFDWNRKTNSSSSLKTLVSWSWMESSPKMK